MSCPARSLLASVRPSILTVLVIAGALSSCPEPSAVASDPARDRDAARGADPSADPMSGPSFDAARAWKDLEALVAIGPRSSGSEGAEKTRQYIERELSAAGLEPKRQEFTEPTPLDPAGLAFCNVYADLAAKGDTKRTSDLILLVSHYDTKRLKPPFVGANDSGSSTAVLLELARVLAAQGPRQVTYRFLFVDGEEAVRDHWQDPDNCYGSRRHAAELPKSGDKNRVKAVVVIDMVGDKDLQIQRDTNSTSWLYECFAAAARKNGLGAHVDGEREPIADDHLSFTAIGLPAVTLIDLNYGPDNSWWHTAEDTLDKCSQESLAAIGKIVLLGLPAVESRSKR
jgi:glutaminyl-peptide cyclotransferase